jgi:hypothetical protein
MVSVLAVSSIAAAASTWTAVPTPNPGTFNTIDGLVAFSPTEIWAIGSATSPTYNGCHGRTLTARWNGSAFVEVATTPTAICAAINGVAGSSTADIWAVGSINSARDTHIRHWNGSTWSVVTPATIPLPPSGGRRLRTTGLNAVTTFGGANAWAVGKAQFADFSRNALVERWNGSAWSLVAVNSAVGSELNAVSGTGASDIWAVGSGGAAGSAAQSTLALHWNGSSWSSSATKNTNTINALRGVAAVASNNVWAVGDAIKTPGDGVSVYRTLIEHWTGSSWTVVPSPNIGAGNNSLQAIKARSASDIWAVGYYDDITGSIPLRRTFTVHWNGTAWSVVGSANPGTGDNWLRSVVAPAGTTQAFASGTSAAGTLVERFAG